MRLTKLLVLAVVVALAAPVAVAPLSEAGNSPAASDAKKKKKKKCKTGYVKKTVKKKNGKRVKKCVKKKKKKKSTGGATPGAYKGTTSQGLAFSAKVASSGRSVSFQVPVRPDCGIGPDTVFTLTGSLEISNGAFRGQLEGRRGSSPFSPDIRGTVKGGTIDATTGGDRDEICRIQDMTLKATL